MMVVLYKMLVRQNCDSEFEPHPYCWQSEMGSFRVQPVDVAEKRSGYSPGRAEDYGIKFS